MPARLIAASRSRLRSLLSRNPQQPFRWSPGRSVYRDVILADTPLVYYRLDAASGTSERDLGSLALNGTYAGGYTLDRASLLPGDPDHAAAFNGGASTFVNIGGGVQIALGDVFSLEAWIKPATIATLGFLFSESGGTGFGPRILINDTGARITVGSSTGGNIVANLTNLVASNIYHVVWVKNGASNVIYINSVDDTGVVTNHTLSTPTGGGDTFWFVNPNGTSNSYNGTADELAIYGYALTAAQVLAHYNAGQGITTVTAQTVSPGLLTVALSLPAPQINQQVAPGVLTVTVTPTAPSIAQSVAPGVLTVTLTVPAPQVNQSVQIPLQTVTISLPAFSIGATPQEVDADILTVGIDAIAPQINQQVAPGVLTVTITANAPNVQAGVNIGVLTVTVTATAPSVLITGPVQPPLLTVALTALAPTFSTGGVSAPVTGGGGRGSIHHAGPFYRQRKRRDRRLIVANSLFDDLIKRYGAERGSQVYDEMQANALGPFAPGAKYGAYGGRRRA